MKSCRSSRTKLHTFLSKNWFDLAHCHYFHDLCNPLVRYNPLECDRRSWRCNPLECDEVMRTFIYSDGGLFQQEGLPIRAAQALLDSSSASSSSHSTNNECNFVVMQLQIWSPQIQKSMKGKHSEIKRSGV